MKQRLIFFIIILVVKSVLLAQVSKPHGFEIGMYAVQPSNPDTYNFVHHGNSPASENYEFTNKFQYYSLVPSTNYLSGYFRNVYNMNGKNLLKTDDNHKLDVFRVQAIANLGIKWCKKDFWNDKKIFDNNTHGTIDSDELKKFDELLYDLGNSLLASGKKSKYHPEYLGGIYLADEPETSWDRIDNIIDYPDNMYTYFYNRIKNYHVVSGADKIKLFENTPVIMTMRTMPAHSYSQKVKNLHQHDYKTYRNSCDLLLLDYYGYTLSKDDHGLHLFNNSLLEARKAFCKKNTTVDTRIGAVLMLGSEIDYHLPIATHSITHAAIRKLFNMGVDALYFYSWNLAPSNDIEGEDDAVNHWVAEDKSPMYYSEALQTEIHDTDQLVVAFSNNNETQNLIYIEDWNKRDGMFNSKRRFASPGKVTTIACGDFYAINNKLVDESKFYCNGDGDDELVFCYNNDSEYTVSHAEVTDDIPATKTTNLNYKGATPVSSCTGDYDGDGDDEFVTLHNENGNSTIKLYELTEKGFTLSSTIATLDNKIKMIASGDFYGNGVDELALVEELGTQDVVHIWTDVKLTKSKHKLDPAKGKYIPGKRITAITAGNIASNFDLNVYEDPTKSPEYYEPTLLRDELIVCFNNENRNGYSVKYWNYFTKNKWIELVNETTHNRVVTAMAAGDITDEAENNNVEKNVLKTMKREDVLFIATANSENGQLTDSKIHLYKPGSKIPVNQSDTKLVYNNVNDDYFHITAITMGSFRESNHPELFNQAKAKVYKHNKIK